MGMILPATAEALGHSYIKENGQYKVLGAKETLTFDIEAGYLTADKVPAIREKIAAIKG